MKVKKTSTLIETLSSLKIEQYVSVGMTLLACVISLILYFEAVKTRDPSGFYISLVVTTTLAVVADRIARFVSENRVMKELESFNPTKQDLHYIGDGNAGIDWFCENYSGVHVVRNTVFRPAHSNVSFIFANLDKFNAVARLIIGPHCVWHDLVVIDTDGDAQKFHGSLSDQQKKSHHVVQLNGDTPLFQMLILEFGNDKSAVLFGWGFDANAGSKVYSSTDNDTVRFFRDYYELLRTKHAATVPEPIPSSLAGHPTPIPNLNQEALIALSFYRPYANFGVQDFSRAASSSSSSSRLREARFARKATARQPPERMHPQEPHSGLRHGAKGLGGCAGHLLPGIRPKSSRSDGRNSSARDRSRMAGTACRSGLREPGREAARAACCAELTMIFWQQRENFFQVLAVGSPKTLARKKQTRPDCGDQFDYAIVLSAFWMRGMRKFSVPSGLGFKEKALNEKQAQIFSASCQLNYISQAWIVFELVCEMSGVFHIRDTDGMKAVRRIGLNA